MEERCPVCLTTHEHAQAIRKARARAKARRQAIRRMMTFEQWQELRRQRF